MDCDVLIVGAGPAGAGLALTLAPRHRVVVIDRRPQPTPRVGESLVPAARRILRDMRILDALEAQRHPAYLGNRSYWGSPRVQEVDFLRDPDGPGWHLDRVRFERFLRESAQARGALVLAPAKLSALARVDGRWRVSVATPGGPRSFSSRLLVDAGGRSAPVAKRLAIPRAKSDRLVAGWIYGTRSNNNAAGAGFSVVESEPEGWWYSAPVPGVDGSRGQVLAFHTDSDLPSASLARDPEALLERARSLPKLGATLERVGFRPAGEPGYCAAHSSHLERSVGDGWLAVGDAALSFDPLASSGLFKALYTAMLGAMACHEALSLGDAISPVYGADLERVRTNYERQLALAYAAETRWPERPFWTRRHSASSKAPQFSPRSLG